MRKPGALVSWWLELSLLSVVVAVPVYGQVGPAEIVNPQLKAAEQEYLPQLSAVNRAVTEMRFPFAFRPSRYAGRRPRRRPRSGGCWREAPQGGPIRLHAEFRLYPHRSG